MSRRCLLSCRWNLFALMVFFLVCWSGSGWADNALLRRIELPGLNPASTIRLVRDSAPGAGVFDSCTSPAGCAYPVLGCGPNHTYHLAFLSQITGRLMYMRMRSWGSWETLEPIADSVPEPGYPTHNLAASKQSGKIVVTWVCEDTTGPKPGFLRVSTDTGTTWGPPIQLDYPPAYLGDTLTSFHLSSLYPFWDMDDRLHVVACVHPIVRDTGFVTPAQIWHWRPDTTPGWTRITRAGCQRENLLGPVGYNALYACRPCIGQDADGYLYAVWEQFDSANVEGSTGLLRAGILMSYGRGSWWYPPRRLVPEDVESCRFPSVAARYPSDSARVIFEQDQVAGFATLSEGPFTNNPIIAATFRLLGPPYVQPETIGGTIYDMQDLGPSHQTAYCDPTLCTHASWLFSAEPCQHFLDLNVRYNFYDSRDSVWHWIDPGNFMNSGVVAFNPRAWPGNLDYDPVSGVAVISSCTDPFVGISEKGSDAAPGALLSSIVRGAVFLTGAERSVLVDVTGRKVGDLLPGRNDVGRLAPGIYFLRRFAPGSQETRKLVLLQ